MPMTSMTTVIPGLRYRDPEGAVRWLTSAFGFVEHGLFRDGQGAIVHAQLTSGSGMIMLGPDSNPDLKELMTTPDNLGGKSTQAVYVVVDDADRHHARATAAGAEVLKPLENVAHGGRGYTCRDPEGHVWEFGTYDPWATSR